jgi:hypothetical protein
MFRYPYDRLNGTPASHPVSIKDLMSALGRSFALSLEYECQTSGMCQQIYQFETFINYLQQTSVPRPSPSRKGHGVNRIRTELRKSLV